MHSHTKGSLCGAEENATEVYVVGPDPDLKRICDAHERLRYFKKLEAMLDYININRAN
jgi:hypothetical protein